MNPDKFQLALQQIHRDAKDQPYDLACDFDIDGRFTIFLECSMSTLQEIAELIAPSNYISLNIVQVELVSRFVIAGYEFMPDGVLFSALWHNAEYPPRQYVIDHFDIPPRHEVMRP